MPTEEKAEEKVLGTPTLKEVIAGAAAEEEPARAEEVKEEKKEEKKPEPEVDQDAVQGKELLLALKNPKTSGQVIDFLARQAGYTKNEIKTPEVAAEAKDDILEILKAELGDEFEFLNKKLGPALDKILKIKLEQSQADIRADLLRQEEEKLTGQAGRALEKIAEDFFGEKEIPEKVMKEMSDMMDKIPASPDMSPSEYLKLCFNATIGSLGLVKTDKAKRERINANRTDAAGRLEGTKPPVGEAASSPKKMSSKEAIRLAIEQLGEQGG